MNTHSSSSLHASEKNKKKKKKKTILNLPQNLMIDILLRLSAKSLTRLKCVCKSWLSLISDPYFANLHYQLVSSTHLQHRLVFSNNNIYHSEIRSIDFNSPSLDYDSHDINSLLPEANRPRDLIFGSSRGFMLLGSLSDLYLWNPTIGFHKQLPLPPGGYSDLYSFRVGFGYDPSTHDYLVILVSTSGFNVLLFSLKANTWAEWEGPRLPNIRFLGSPRYKTGSLFNGAIHWFAYHVDTKKDCIAVFDLVERTFSEISLPHGFNLRDDYHDFLSKLREFGGFLSICAPWSSLSSDAGGIWVMEEYKVESSWTKRDIVAYRPIQLFPICCTKSGDIVGIDFYSGLVIFNSKGEGQKYPHHCDANALDVVMYTQCECLFTLPSDRLQAEQDESQQLTRTIRL